ncbi:hypothetical protein OPT61_g3544 [Boeremia exigua]|uniref:Uncharacterized protein n=1 Tax=Boeremia exigua TaxID=749465 RepID=A0ACC2IHM4_9PLEO|nr:hypothetical protein OPT61_g3544 [Boeremia exigua]
MSSTYGVRTPPPMGDRRLSVHSATRTSPSQGIASDTVLDEDASQQKPDVPKDAVLIMGLTGSGKSTFISLLAEEEVQIGHRLESCTTKAEGYAASVQGRLVLMMDTPGFDDTARSDLDIVNEVILGLAEMDRWGVTIIGVIYMQRITDTRMSGSARKSLEILNAICGERALADVTFVTTMWDKLGTDEALLGAQRTEELERLFLTNFIQNGSQVRRHYGTVATAEDVMGEILSRNHPVLLDLQSQMVEGDLPLEQTSVGRILQHDLLEQQKAFNAEKTEIEQQLLEAQQANDRKLVEILSEDSERLERQLQHSQGSQMQLRYNAHQLRANSYASIEQQREEARKLEMERGEPTNAGLQMELDRKIQQTESIVQRQEIEAQHHKRAMRKQSHNQKSVPKASRGMRADGTLWTSMIQERRPRRHQPRYEKRNVLVRRTSYHVESRMVLSG